MRRSIRLLPSLLGFCAVLGSSVHAATNSPPVAANDRVVVRGTSFVLIDVLANDADADGDVLSATATGGATVVNQGDGLFLFQPGSCLADTFTFTYQVEDGRGGTATATVELVPGGCGDNVVPILMPDVGNTNPGDPLIVEVLANDDDPDGDALCVVGLAAVANGVATISPDCQRVTFTPTPGFEGTASFRYRASDGRGGEGEAPVTIAVRVQPPGLPLTDDEVVTERDKILAIPSSALIANDDPGTVFVTAISTATDRVDVVRPATGQAWLLYTPPAGVTGTRTFRYQADFQGSRYEATVTVRVGVPVGSMRAVDDRLRTIVGGCATVDLDVLIDNDRSSGEGIAASGLFASPVVGTLTAVAGSGGRRFTYRPPAGWQGVDFLTYTVADVVLPQGGSTDVATLVIDVQSPGAANARNPVAQLDLPTVNTVTTPYVEFNVLANDYDPDCGGLVLEGVQHDGVQAVVSSHANGLVRYDPRYTTVGTDTFTYWVRDAQGILVQGTVRVTLIGEILPPWPRLEYRSCQARSTCVVSGLASRRGNGSNYSWEACTVYWHYEGVNGPPPATPDCWGTPADRGAEQNLSSKYAAPGLERVELTLWDSDVSGHTHVRATSGIYVPVGGTTVEWTIGHSCDENTCTFWPVGNWLPGVVERFEWYFDYPGGAPPPPDQVTYGPQALTETYPNARAGEEKTVALFFYVFDRPNGFALYETITIPPPPPAAPTGLATDNTECAASGPRLSWVDGSHVEEGFHVYRGVNGGAFTLHAVLDEDETELQDFYTGPRTDVLSYRVAAFNEAGERSSAAVSGRPTPADCGGGQQPPVPPSHLAADPPSRGVRLSWRDNSALEAGFKVYKRVGTGAFALVSTIGAGREWYYDAPVAPGSSLAYRVSAFNGAGESAPSADLAVTVPNFLFADSFEAGNVSAWSGSTGVVASLGEGGEASAVELVAGASGARLLRPSDLAVVAFRGGGAEISWRDNTLAETGFEVLRKERGGAYATVATLPADATGFVDGPLEAGRKYRYRVVAIGAEGQRRKSEVLRVEPPVELFADAFETPDLGAWSAEADAAARLAPSFGAALFGNAGLELDLGAAAPAFVTDDNPAAERRYRARFMVDGRGLDLAAMEPGALVATIAEARTEGGASEVFALRLVKLASGLGLEARLGTTAGPLLAPAVELDAEVHQLELDWEAVRPDGGSRFRLWLDDRRVAKLEGWSAGELAIGELRFGKLEGVAVTGKLALDELVTRRGGQRIRRAEVAGAIFKDGFEFADLPNWTSHTAGGGDVSVLPGNLAGRTSLELQIDGQGQQAFVERNLYWTERHLLASFELDASGLALPAGKRLALLSGHGYPATDALFELRLEGVEGGLELQARARDGAGWSSRKLPLPAGPTRIELEWRTATGGATADGSLILRVIDEQGEDSAKRSMTTLATGAERVFRLRLGVSESSPQGASGVVRVDELELWR